MELENASSKKGQAFFIPHPHPPVKDCSEPIHAVTGKLTALISGGGQGFPRLYSGEYLPRLIKTLANSANDFRDQYRICLVGKGYESHAEELRQAGYEVKVRSWVENYSELLGECQIQIFPIQVGSGTKGKVLQAMGSGLLAIATPMAMENISAEPDQDYLLYEIPEQVPLLLARILSDRTAASQIALAGRDAILRWHNPEYTASLFWKHVLRSYAQTTTHRDNGDI